MKMKIAWHKECLKNRSQYTLEQEKQLFELHRKVEKLNIDTAILLLQIQTAEERGLKEFDSERFMKKQLTNFTEIEEGL